MPIYPRRCVCCRHTFEELCALDRRDAIRCPECGAATVTNAGELVIHTEKTYINGEAVDPFRDVNPSEVTEARRLFEHTGARVRDDGHIEVGTRTIAKKFREVWRANKEASGEGPARRLPRPGTKVAGMTTAEKRRRGLLPRFKLRRKPR